MTPDDAERYFVAYREAIEYLGNQSPLLEDEPIEESRHFD